MKRLLIASLIAFGSFAAAAPAMAQVNHHPVHHVVHHRPVHHRPPPRHRVVHHPIHH